MNVEPQIGKAAGRRAAVRAAAAIAVLVLIALALVFVSPGNLFLWIKALHVIAVIAWMAGMLYLPRLFVYHCDAEKGSPQSETFKVMEQRLLRLIINPAMIVAWALGLWMIYTLYPIPGYWIWVKLAAVIGLSALHGHFAKAVRLFAEDRNEKPARYWRMMNEVPAVLMIVIVVMVIVQPI